MSPGAFRGLIMSSSITKRAVAAHGLAAVETRIASLLRAQAGETIAVPYRCELTPAHNDGEREQ